MLLVMDNNVDLDNKINGSDEKHVVVDTSIEENRGRHVDDVSSSGKLIETGEARVSDGVKNEDFESVAGNVESVDRMFVDSIGGGVKIKKSKKLSGGNGGSEKLEVGDGSVRDKESAAKGTIRKVKKDKSGEKLRKKHERVEKSSVSGCDSVYEELGENGRCRALEKQRGGYDIGDLVWGKVKSHPWWPGQIYSEELASSEVRRSKTEGYILVAFFGDCSYGWFDPAELVPFESNYAEKSRQTNSRTFVKAVEEAVDEASRRRSLGLACRCRNPNNFRPTTVKGYVAVDVGDYEAGTIYSIDQIKKSRNDFKPTEILDFVNRLALSPINVEHGAIDFVKDKAATLAYRKAVYDEFDKTYAQAFGQQPELPSHGHTQVLDQSLKVPTPAPLSGPLVFAEVLRKGKGAKLTKSKDAKKDQYLFKRREPNESNMSAQADPGQTASSEQTVYMDGSLATASGDYTVQKKSPSVSTKQKVSVKHQPTKKSAKDGVSSLRQEAGGKGSITLDDKPYVAGSSLVSSQINQTTHAQDQCSHVVQATSFLSKGTDAGLGSQESTGAEVGMGHVGITISDSVANISSPIDEKDDEAGLTSLKSAESLEQSSSQEAKTELRDEQVRDGFTGHSSGTASVKSHKQGPYLNDGIKAKKVKVRKQPSDEVKRENSIPLKKKRKKDSGSDDTKMRQYVGKVESSVGNLAEVPVSVAKSSTENLLVESQKKEDSISPESMVAQKMILEENIVLELPQLLHSLQTLAVNYRTGSSNSMAVVRQAFLTYRSLVFEKKFASPQNDTESTEFSATEHPAVARAGDVTAENIRERPSLKLQRQVIRPDDPAKGGRKRGPSDRQEENAARKKKKINDMKVLTAEKKTALKVLAAEKNGTQKAQVMASGSTAKSLKPAPLKKSFSPSRAPEPTMLVMKFPPQGTLPSVMELKARFARFGQLDHSGTRIFWKTSTCRLVYRNKADAESACKFASNNNLFGNSNVRCYTRAVEVAAPITEPGKAQKEDSTMVSSQLKESVVERRPAASLPSRTQQSGGQLRSILKKSNGEETSGTNGGSKKPRVKFVLGEEETNRGGEQLMIGNKNMSSNASFAGGGASSSSGMDNNSKNIVIPPSPLPTLALPTTTAAVHFQRPPNYLQFSEIAPRNGPNLNMYAPQPVTPSVPNTDVSQQMMSLLYKCNDVVTKLSDFLGYEPLHRL